MSASDKVSNAATQVIGRVKEAAGAITGNVDLKATGQREQFTSNLKQAGENLKDSLFKVRDALGF
jgi:uncharacterized protein YjbJ (UPF0337 family)